MNKFNNFGYPVTGDNVQEKPQTITDILSLNATGFYNLFTLSPDQTSRNKQFPLAGTEIFVLDEISIFSGAPFIGAENIAAMFKSYFQIIKNNKEVLKIPLAEIVNFENLLTIGTTGVYPINYNFQNRTRKLKYPIVVNSNESIIIRIYYDKVGSSTFAGTINLFGYQYDKLSDFSLDLRKDDNYEALSYTLYDYNDLTQQEAKDYRLFDTASKPENLFSKPLNSPDQIFMIENIEVFLQATTANTSTVTMQNTLSQLNKFSLLLTTDSKEILNVKTNKMFSVIKYTSGGFKDADNTDIGAVSLETYSASLTLKKPVIIKANSNNLAILKVPQTYPGGNGYVYFNTGFLICLKGTLLRKVS